LRRAESDQQRAKSLQTQRNLQSVAGTQSASSGVMSSVITYRDLEVWKQSMTLVEDCYRSTMAFPGSELYGLTSQLRRAAVSIPSNVAEGHCRPTTRAYTHYVGISLGSHGELETCIEIARRLTFLEPDETRKLLETANSVGRLLNGLYSSLERKLARENDRP
jgi:four helix bundle protein